MSVKLSSSLEKWFLETALCIFSGPHSTEANLETRNFFFFLAHAPGEQFSFDWIGAIFESSIQFV